MKSTEKALMVEIYNEVKQNLAKKGCKETDSDYEDKMSKGMAAHQKTQFLQHLKDDENVRGS